MRKEIKTHFDRLCFDKLCFDKLSIRLIPPNELVEAVSRACRS